MAITDPDDIVERLIKRKEIQTSLKDVTTEEDLVKIFEDNLEGSGKSLVYMKNLDAYRWIDNSDLKERLIEGSGDLIETRKIEIQLIDNVSRLEDLDKIQNVIDKNPTLRLQAKQRGKEVSKEFFDIGNKEEFEKAINWLEENNPQYLGYLKGIKTYQERGKSFRLIFA